ncbi:hypothetical protein EE612_026484 [Oryza sativa]|nr:hypothetical protein EE612_026484 [Oryza sativa]
MAEKHDADKVARVLGEAVIHIATEATPAGR